MLMWSSAAFAFEDTGAFYREETDAISINQTCGDLCVTSPGYYQSYLFFRERNTRFYAPLFKAKVKKEKTKEDHIRSYRARSHVQGLSWGREHRISNALITKPVRWSRMARDVGFRVAERGKSLRSAFWAEIKKPVLFELRDRVLAPYRGKKLSFKEKVNAWFIDQTIDSGASSLGYDGYGGAAGTSNMDFGIKDYRLKYSPRLDPIKGRYGFRLKYKRYVKRTRPLYMVLGFNYCKSAAGIGNRICLYRHEVSGSIATANMTKRTNVSLYVSYQTDSPDEGAYEIDGEAYEHKRWVSGMRFTYAFY